MIRTFLPVVHIDGRTGYIPLNKIEFIDPGPKEGGGHPCAWTEAGARYTLVKGWQDPLNHLTLGVPG